MPKLLVLFLLSLSSSAVCAEPPKGGVTATLALVAPDKLSIKYDIPDSCQALSFINNGIPERASVGIRSDWQASDDCGALDGRGVRRTGAACTSLQFTVPANERFYDRVYPWTFPIGGGLYSHTSAFALDSSCGPVSWRFSAKRRRQPRRSARLPHCSRLTWRCCAKGWGRRRRGMRGAVSRRKKPGDACGESSKIAHRTFSRAAH